MDNLIPIGIAIHYTIDKDRLKTSVTRSAGHFRQNYDNTLETKALIFDLVYNRNSKNVTHVTSVT